MSLKAHISDMQRAENERLEALQLELVRLEQQRLEDERLERERLERERLEQERLRKVRIEQERLEQERIEQERNEQERLEHEQLEIERLERERLEKEQLEQEKMAEEARLLAERNRLEEANRALEQDRLREEMQRAESEERAWLQKLEREEHRKAKRDKRDADACHAAVALGDKGSTDIEPSKKSNTDDVFSSNIAVSLSNQAPAESNNGLKARVLELGRRLRSISIKEVASSSSSDHLPSVDQWRRMDSLFSSVTADVARLPPSPNDPTVNADLQSLRAELEESSELMQHIRNLSGLSAAVQLCDMALSDLLEHIDSYPSPPFGPLSSSHVTQVRLPPEKQLAARLSFTRSTVTDMTAKFSSVANDSRAITERKRIDQTWSELEEMGNELISARKSRPSSVISSGRNSRASLGSSHSSAKTLDNDKKGGYSKLSVKTSARGPTARSHFLSPAQPSSRLVVSGSSDTHSRSKSRLSSVPSNRSVSGPMSSSSSNPAISTFASRQRTSSLSSATTASFVTPVKHNVGTPSLSRSQASQVKRIASPAFPNFSSLSQTQSHSRSFSLSNSRSQATPSRSTSSMSSTWARAPRQSFPVPTIPTPPRKPPPPKKTYIANPKNKLDVAVGDVVNKLPVNINVAIVPETWKDQSGKYWIGDQDPKLCFCRILRSRTVMVRVGGGWTELSKFIKDHFADLFRLMPDSPRPVAQEEKWISSTTLLETPETPPESPRTPEPKGPLLPSFSLSTPSGRSPRSLKSTPSSGSPLTPLQFMRRAEQDHPGLRPISPSKPPVLRARNTAVQTPSRSSIWRP